jgi:hypothetical protein
MELYKNLIILVILSFLTACSGGFYTLRKASIQDNTLNTAVESQPMSVAELPYLDINVIPRLNRLESPEFQSKRNGVIEYLIIYVSFNHKALGGMVKIPIYYIDLKNGQKKLYESYRIVNKFPLIQNARFSNFLRFHTIAIEKSYANSVTEVLQQLEQSDNAIASAITSNSPANSIISAINFGTEILDKFAKKTQYNTDQPIQILSPINPELNRAYIIVPTNRNGTVSKDIDSLISRTNYSIEKDANGDLYVMDKSEKLDFQFPYLILNYSLTNYVFDPDLNVNSDGTMALIDADRIERLENRVKNAERKLLLPDHELNELFSLEQLNYESGYFARLRLLVELRKAAYVMRSSTDSTKKADNNLIILNRYYQYKSELSDVDTSSILYMNYFKSKYSEVDESIQRVFNSVILRSAEIILIVESIDKINRRDYNIDSFLEVNSLLNKLDYYKDISSTYKWSANSNIISRARTSKTLLEGEIYESKFRNSVGKLDLENCSANSGALISLLNPLSVDYSNCEICVSSTSTAIISHGKKCESVLGEVKSEIFRNGITLKNEMNKTLLRFEALSEGIPFDNLNITKIKDFIQELEIELDKVDEIKYVSIAKERFVKVNDIKTNYLNLVPIIESNLRALEEKILEQQQISEGKDKLISEISEIIDQINSDLLLYTSQTLSDIVDVNFVDKLNRLKEQISFEIATIQSLSNLSEINSYSSRKLEFISVLNNINKN